jgi:hypothetical protein
VPMPAAPRTGDQRHGGRTTDRGFTAAFELVMTPALFAFIGHLIDGKLGTGRIFTLVLAIVVGAYEVWKLWYGYNAEVASLEAEMFQPRSVPTPVLSAEDL